MQDEERALLADEEDHGGEGSIDGVQMRDTMKPKVRLSSDPTHLVELNRDLPTHVSIFHYFVGLNRLNRCVEKNYVYIQKRPARREISIRTISVENWAEFHRSLKVTAVPVCTGRRRIEQGFSDAQCILKL